MKTDKIKETAKKYALQNAVLYEGKANENAVVGKVIAVLKKEKIPPQEIIPVVTSIVQQINKMTSKEQVDLLEKLAPELLQKQKKERDFSLPPLPFAEPKKVVTRFPPEPNGYLHIGHAKAAIIDSEYAQMYDGKFILRFDDTNPENAELEFYTAQKKDLQWLGIHWDEEYNTSDHLKTHYQLAEQLIEQGDAYICKCPPEVIKKGRFHAKSCSCKQRAPAEALELWKDLLTSNESTGAILRLHGQMDSPNTAMRDPTLFRVIEKNHPIQGDNYRVWPTYDFAGAIEDSISGVTHPFRTKEYELRDPVYFRILSLLNLRKPHLMEFSRLSLKGMPVSKRKIKPLIDNKLVSGYDDIRLPTLRGLHKRGIIPETIKQFVLSQGISKTESTADFSLVEAINRKILDPQVKRYFYVQTPVKLIVHDAPQKTIQLPFHPTTNLGNREVHTTDTFFIPQEDIQDLTKDDIFRLKGLYNIKITKKNKELIGTYAGENIIPASRKIQWTTQHYVPMKLYKPGPLFINDTFNTNSLNIIDGYAEQAASNLQTGDIIQFERVGFVRIEQHDHHPVGFFSHK